MDKFRKLILFIGYIILKLHNAESTCFPSHETVTRLVPDMQVPCDNSSQTKIDVGNLTPCGDKKDKLQISLSLPTLDCAEEHAQLGVTLYIYAGKNAAENCPSTNAKRPRKILYSEMTIPLKGISNSKNSTLPGKLQYVTFHNIIKGCYKLLVELAKSEGGYKTIHIGPVFVDNEFKAENFKLNVISPEFPRDRRTIKDHSSVLIDIKMTPILAQTDPTAVISLMVSPEPLSSCSNNSKNIELPSINCASSIYTFDNQWTCNNYSQMTRVRSEENDWTHLLFNISTKYSGKFTLTLMYEDERCSHGPTDFWRNLSMRCCFNIMEVPPAQIPDEVNPTTNSTLPSFAHQVGITEITLMTVVGCIFILVLILSILWKAHGRHLSSQRQASNELSVKLINGRWRKKELKILLLYAREEGEFQLAVQNLRQEIQEKLESEVVDIYHDDYEQVMNRQGIGFMTELLQQDSETCNKFEVKVILIHTDWSVEIYQSHLSGKAVTRRRQEYLDSYYIPSLKMVLEDTENSNYGNVFNVEFSTFPLKKPHQKPVINNMVNYVIPLNLQRLCNALRSDQSAGREDESSLHNSQ